MSLTCIKTSTRLTAKCRIFGKKHAEKSWNNCEKLKTQEMARKRIKKIEDEYFLERSKRMLKIGKQTLKKQNCKISCDSHFYRK